MAKLHGTNIAEALGAVIVNHPNGAYLRGKGSLTRKQVLKSKAFEKTRQYAGKMAIASRLGSEIYRSLTLKKRDRSLYQAITGEAASLLYNGYDEDSVRERLRKKYEKISQ
jgi:hypothetical protein